MIRSNVCARWLTVVCLLALSTAPLVSQDAILNLHSVETGTSENSSQLLRSVQKVYGTHIVSIESAQLNELLRQRPEAITLALPVSFPVIGNIRVRKYELLTNDAQIVVRNESGDRPLSIRSRWSTYHGSVEGVEGSLVVVNISPEGVDAVFDLKQQRFYLKAVPGAVTEKTLAHVLIPAHAMKQMPFTCGNVPEMETPGSEAFMEQFRARRAEEGTTKIIPSDVPSTSSQSYIPSSILKGAISGDTIEVRVALEGDYDLKVMTGTVDSAVALMLATVSYSSAIYERDVMVQLKVPFVRVWEIPSDPYPQEIFSSLDQLALTWKASMDTVQRTVVHLFTSSTNWSVQTGVAGIARLNTLCSTVNGYGVTDVRNPGTEDHFMTFSHELGHNFGAYHTHSCLWPNGPIDYCSAVEGGCYSGAIVPQSGTIMSYCSPRVFEFGPIVSALIRRNTEVAWCAPSIAQVPVATSDSTFLQSLYSGANGASWSSKTNWTGPISGRYGVAVRNGRVVSIDLPANNIQGALPSGLTDLTELRRLNLSGRNHYRMSQVDPPDPPTDVFNQNRLTGQIPSNIQIVTKLEYLDVSNNLLTGSIPSGIGNLDNLFWLNLSENQLTGTIPTTLGGLTGLELLDLSRNQLTGGIPTELGSMSNLRYLVITENGQLGGAIPSSLGSLSKLIILIAYKSALTGSIPVELGNLSQLTDLDLGTNQLTGSIPTQLGNISGLQNLTLMENQLTGSIPSSIGGLQKMVGLRLQSNMLSGSLPPEIGNMNLWALFLGKNQLSGTIPLSFGNLTELVEFDLSENQLTGPLPDTLKHIGEDFYPGLGGFFEFTVNDNQLTGPLPNWIGEETQFNTISTLKLGGNNFTGTSIPAWIMEKPFIGRLWLHDLGFTDTIPSQLGTRTFLNELKLSGNQFSGPIPAALGNLTNLSLLWLSDNQLSGEIPTQLGNITGMMYLRLSNNQLTGQVPDGFSSMIYLSELGLDNNELENVPALGNMQILKQNPASFTAIQNNRLMFDDIAPLAGLGLKNFTFAPQKPFGPSRTLSVSPGSDVRLSVTVGGVASGYQWKKNGTNIGGAASREYQITGVSASDTADYTVAVTNSSLPSLTLQREPYRIVLHNLAYPQDMTLASPGDGDTVTFPVALNWSLEALATRYDVQIDTTSAFAAPVFRDSAVTGLGRTYSNAQAPRRYYWRVRAANPQGIGFWSDVRSFMTTGVGTGIVEEGGVAPAVFALSQNFPNPFNPTTTISFTIPVDGSVMLVVYDILGREVATLVNEELKAGIIHQVRFDASQVSSGMYFYRLSAGEQSVLRKMVLLK